MTVLRCIISFSKHFVSGYLPAGIKEAPLGLGDFAIRTFRERPWGPKNETLLFPWGPSGTFQGRLWDVPFKIGTCRGLYVTNNPCYIIAVSVNVCCIMKLLEFQTVIDNA